MESMLNTEIRSKAQTSEVDAPLVGEAVTDWPVSDAPETEIVHSRKVACDGGEGALGHPRVWLTIPAQGFIDCGYCDKRYILAEDADTH